jgi:nucleoside-diphosphate-sugar epimerase
MKVFIIGGTGLLGSETARVLLEQGHEVSSLALPPLPHGVALPKAMKISYGNYMEMSDDELRNQFVGMDGFVFAAGIDERVEGKPPVYQMFKKYNIDALERSLRLAKEAGVKHVAICGSYFAYFARRFPEWKLTKFHPYIRSRIDQEEMALSFADDNFAVSILELPYIFGTQPGRKPVWTFLVEMIKAMKKATFYPRGGTTMVTVHQVAEGLAGALQKNNGGHLYPFGYYNMTWKEMLTIFHKYMGYSSKRKIITIPDFLFRMKGSQIDHMRARHNIEGGLNMRKFTQMQTTNLFINKEEGADFLGVKPDDIDARIGDSVKLCLDIIDNKVNDVVDMKGE